MDISIVIPTFNPGNKLRFLLNILLRQKTEFQFEILCIDSALEDNTLEICKLYNVRYIKIWRNRFNHGLTRNLGISKSDGRFIILMTQDAVPANEFWMQRLIEKFDSDKRVAGVFSKQIPREDSEPLVKKWVNDWFSFHNEIKIRGLNGLNHLEKITPMERYRLCYIDNVSCAIRRDVWEKFPFSETYFGEDIEWGKRVIEAGYKIIYAPDSVVIHSHNRSVFYEFKRTYYCHRRLYNLFKLHTVPDLKSFLKFSLKGAFKETVYSIKNESKPIKKIKYLIKIPIMIILVTFAQYIAVKDEEKNKKVPNFKI